MGVAAGSCIGLNFGQTSEIVLVLAFLFVCLTGGDIDELFAVANDDALKSMVTEEDKTFLLMHLEYILKCRIASVYKYSEDNNLESEKGNSSGGRESTGMAVCLTFMSGRAGVIIGSIMIGALVDTNCSIAFYVLAALALVCAVLACLLPSQNK
uniref:Uncharacterized protein n=1 Tax=Timema douglasi TaxID=61478 RepID=A0A7R8ZDD8_TIMDO|nr:unnamed protein product [Timema douglasi]